MNENKSIYWSGLNFPAWERGLPKSQIILHDYAMQRFLDPKQWQELLDELSREGNRRYADRIRTILLIDDGKPLIKIAEYLFLDEGTVRNWRKRYDEGGIEKLLNDYS